jgi:hypothetical protein
MVPELCIEMDFENIAALVGVSLPLITIVGTAIVYGWNFSLGLRVSADSIFELMG